jgi:hypothetical protein
MRFAGSQLSNFMDPTNFDAISFASMGGETEKTNALNTAYGARDIGGIQGDMYRDMGQYEAMGIKAQGSAQGQSSMMSGLASGISGLAGGIANMPGAGGAGAGGFGNFASDPKLYQQSLQVPSSFSFIN